MYTILHHSSYQVQIFSLGEQFDVGTATVNACLEVHLIPEENHQDNYISTGPCLSSIHLHQNILFIAQGHHGMSMRAVCDSLDDEGHGGKVERSQQPG